jgi:hypothetical protein
MLQALYLESLFLAPATFRRNNKYSGDDSAHAWQHVYASYFCSSKPASGKSGNFRNEAEHSDCWIFNCHKRFSQTLRFASTAVYRVLRAKRIFKKLFLEEEVLKNIEKENLELNVSRERITKNYLYKHRKDIKNNSVNGVFGGG